MVNGEDCVKCNIIEIDKIMIIPCSCYIGVLDNPDNYIHNVYMYSSKAYRLCVVISN